MDAQQGLLSGSTVAQRCVDGFAFGALICDEQGRVVYANDAAEGLAAGNSGLVFRSHSRSLTAHGAGDAKKLAELIRRACRDEVEGCLLVHNRSHDTSLIVLVSPLRAATPFQSDSGHALLAIRSIDAPAAFDASRLSELFKLSPAQATLAVALYEGKSFEEIAGERGVKISTLRSHFAEVLSRTGARGLRDLIRRLGMIPPLR